MKNKLIRFVYPLVAVACIPALSYATVTTLDPNNPDDCAKFNNPNTVIAVHKEGCSFGPILEAKANDPKYSAISFYQILLTKQITGTLICGKTWGYDPMLFIINSKGQEIDNEIVKSDFNDWFNRSLDALVTSPSIY